MHQADNTQCAVPLPACATAKCSDLYCYGMQLEEIQSRLLDVGSAVATPLDTTKSTFKLNRTKFDSEAVNKVEVCMIPNNSY